MGKEKISSNSFMNTNATSKFLIKSNFVNKKNNNTQNLGTQKYSQGSDNK